MNQRMNRENLIQLASEAIFDFPNENPFDFTLKTTDQLERFASLVVEHQQASAEFPKMTLKDRNTNA